MLWLLVCGGGIPALVPAAARRPAARGVAGLLRSRLQWKLSLLILAALAASQLPEGYMHGRRTGVRHDRGSGCGKLMSVG